MARASASRKAAPAATQSGAEDPRMHALLEAAESIFIAKGYHTATMADVAKAAGMSKKTVYQLIDSKAELFVALFNHYHSMLTFPTPQPEWSAHTILEQNLLCLGRFLLSAEQIALVRLIMAEYTHSPDLGRVFHQNRFKKAKARLETCLTDIARREDATLTNVGELAAMLFGMAVGEFHLSVLIGYRPPPTKTALESRIHHAVETFLVGCGCGVGK